MKKKLSKIRFAEMGELWETVPSSVWFLAGIPVARGGYRAVCQASKRLSVRQQESCLKKHNSEMESFACCPFLPFVLKP